MLPIRDANPTHRVPVITLLLIAVNVAVFFTEPLFKDSEAAQARYFFCNAVIPQEVRTGEQLPQTQPICPGKSIAWSVLLSMFLHGGWLHIAGNMLFLWIFGNNVEDRLGPVKFPIFYLLSGVAATYAQVYISSGESLFVPMVGASGAVAGVLGAYLLMFPRARVTTLIFFYIVAEVPAFVVLAAWFVMQVFQGVGSIRGVAGGGVAYWAHIGGFVAGMALLVLLRPSARPVRRRAYDD